MDRGTRGIEIRNYCSGCTKRVSPKTVDSLLLLTIPNSKAPNIIIVALDPWCVRLCTKVVGEADIGEEHRGETGIGLEAAKTIVPGAHINKQAPSNEP